MRGLVLQGGGARGAFQMGAWKAFRELGIEFDVITGTSIGSMNGALMVQGDYDKCYDIWYNLTPNTLMEGDIDTYNDLINTNIDFKDPKKYFDYFKKTISQGGLDIDPLIELINDVADEEKIRNAKTAFGLVTISLTDKEIQELFIEDIPKGRLKDYLLASAFWPIFKPVDLHGKKFLDGGAYDNLPINLLMKKPVTEIVTIELSYFNIKPLFKGKNIKMKRIIPSGDLGKRFNFSNEQARRSLEMGYLDTLKVYDAIGGFKYYLDNIPSDDEVEELVNHISGEDIASLADFLGERSTGKRVLYERIIPEIARVADADAEDGYADIYVKALEMVAKKNKVERIKRYDFVDFSKAVVASIEPETGKDDFADILKMTGLGKYFYGDQLINEFLLIMDRVSNK